MKRLIVWDKDEVEFIDEEEQHEDNDEEKIHINLPKQPLVVKTNFGTFEEDSPDNPYNSREIFVAHYNFDIYEEDVLKISLVQGVEALKMLTRYSFTVIIGIMFYFEDVLDSIEKTLNIEEVDLDYQRTEQLVDDNTELITDTLKELKTEFWNIYLFPNGNKIIEEYTCEQEVKDREEYFINLKNLSEGIFLTSLKH